MLIFFCFHEGPQQRHPFLPFILYSLEERRQLIVQVVEKQKRHRCPESNFIVVVCTVFFKAINYFPKHVQYSGC